MFTLLISRKKEVIFRVLLIAAFAFCSIPVISQSLTKDTVSLSDLKKISRADIDKLYVTEKVADIRLKDDRQFHANRAIFTEYLRYLTRVENDDANFNEPSAIIFTKLEFEAVFPGGMEAWQVYLKNNLRYPTTAMERKIQGAVVVMMIVDVDGAITEVEAIAGPSELRQHAIELVKGSGKWLPGIQNKRVVKSYKKIPVVFALGGKAYSQRVRSTEYSKLAIFSTNQNVATWKSLPLRKDGAPQENLPFSISLSTSAF
jgi:protein TonB